MDCGEVRETAGGRAERRDTASSSNVNGISPVVTVERSEKKESVVRAVDVFVSGRETSGDVNKSRSRFGAVGQVKDVMSMSFVAHVEGKENREASVPC